MELLSKHSRDPGRKDQDQLVVHHTCRERADDRSLESFAPALADPNCRVKGESVRCALGLSPRRRPWGQHGPQCWYGIDTDPGGLDKAMWQEILTECNCKALPSCLSCDGHREKPSRTNLGERKDKHRNWMIFWNQRIAKRRAPCTLRQIYAVHGTITPCTPQ